MPNLEGNEMDLKVAGGAVRLIGNLNEDFDEKELVRIVEQEFAEGLKPPLDFRDVRRANSCGIAALLRVLDKTKRGAVFVHCPVWLVEQMNQIDEFFDLGVSVGSVYVPYVSKSGGDFVLKLVNVPGGFLESEAYAGIETAKSEDGDELVADFDAEDYFHFLHKQKA